ncbi:MAG: hypothetical protein R3B09_16700 [Nannocystaceae bacterium]
MRPVSSDRSHGAAGRRGRPANAPAIDDVPRALVLWRVCRRSFLHWVRRTELWNGNRERGSRAWVDPDHPIRWSWTKHPEYRVSYAARFAAPEWAHLERVRLRSRREVRALLARLTGPRGGEGRR